MKKNKFLVFIFLLFGCQTVFSAEMKIAVIDVDAAIQASRHVQKINEQLEKEFGPEQTDLKALQKEIMDIQTKFQKDSAIMGESEMRRLQQEIAEKQSRFKFESMELQRKAQARQQQLSEPLMKIVQDTLEEFEKEGKYDLILHKQATLMVKDTMDLTKQLTEKLNQKQ